MWTREYCFLLKSIYSFGYNPSSNANERELQKSLYHTTHSRAANYLYEHQWNERTRESTWTFTLGKPANRLTKKTTTVIFQIKKLIFITGVNCGTERNLFFNLCSECEIDFQYSIGKWTSDTGVFVSLHIVNNSECLVSCFIFPLFMSLAGHKCCCYIFFNFVARFVLVSLFFLSFFYPGNWLNWPNGYQNGMYSKHLRCVSDFRLKISEQFFFGSFVIFIDVRVWAVTQVAAHISLVVVFRFACRVHLPRIVIILWYV